MDKYSGIVDTLMNDSDLLKKLRPTEISDFTKLLKVRAATDADIAGGKAIHDPSMFALVRAGLLYACDAIDESHKVVQEVGGDESAYWHGMIHRREGDFENARYWYRRTGSLPFFGELHHEASMFSAVVAAQPDWDPYLFTGLCEQERFGDRDLRVELARLQVIEFRVVFDYVWRRALTPRQGPAK